MAENSLKENLTHLTIVFDLLDASKEQEIKLSENSYKEFREKFIDTTTINDNKFSIFINGFTIIFNKGE
jgi:hypothetical protein